MANVGNRYYAHQLGSMFDHQWGIIDANDDSLFRNWRGSGMKGGIKQGRKGRIWVGTEREAEELAALMNQGAISELGKVSIVAPAFDPPVRENARYRAIARNREAKMQASRKATQGMVSQFARCDQCGLWTKANHECRGRKE